MITRSTNVNPYLIILLLLVFSVALQLPEAATPGAYAQIFTPIPMPQMQFFDNAGAPCNACRLYTYVINTSTSASTWSESTGVTANANPVVMDANGRATVFFSSAVNYRMMLRDTTDATTYFDIQGVRFAAVDSINGTANQVTVSGTTGSVTVSLAGPHNFTTLTQFGSVYGNAAGALQVTAAGTTASILSTTNGTAPWYSAAPGFQSWTATHTAFASLGTPAQGTVAYCNNCIGPSTTGSVTCTAGGSGALAVYVGGGAWSCK